MTPTRGPGLSRSVVADRPGRLTEVLTVRELTQPDDLDPGEVMVRMIFSTINPSDAITVSGAYGSRTAFPLVPGFEGVGVIEQAAADVPPELLGRRVLPLGSAGCWAQYKRLPLSWCVLVPDDAPDEVACFAYINPLTAHLMVESYFGSQTRRVAITAATSTIADQLAQLTNQHGLRPIGLVRGTPGRTVADPSRWLALIDTSDPAWPEQVRRKCDDNLDVAFDCVGGAQALALHRQLARGGVLVHFGLVSGQPLPAECFDHRTAGRVEMFRLRDTIHSIPRAQLRALFAPVFAQLSAGGLLTRITDRVALTALPAFVRDHPLPSGGKILIDCQR